jgi:hypothetical protein
MPHHCLALVNGSELPTLANGRMLPVSMKDLMA